MNEDKENFDDARAASFLRPNQQRDYVLRLGNNEMAEHSQRHQLCAYLLGIIIRGREWGTLMTMFTDITCLADADDDDDGNFPMMLTDLTCLADADADADEDDCPVKYNEKRPCAPSYKCGGELSEAQ